MSGIEVLSIRPALADEIWACAELYERVARATFVWQPVGYANAHDFVRFALEEEVWLADQGGFVVGTLSLDRPASFVHSLYVDPARQGQGVGRALVAAVAATIDQPLSLKVQLPSRGARAFYRRLGFVEIEDGLDANGVGWLLLRQEVERAQPRRAGRHRTGG